MCIQKTFIIKPTMNCNLRCSYCYEFNKNGNIYNKDKISIECLEHIINKTAQLFHDSRILWLLHGGEPLLLGTQYVESFVNTIRNARNDFKVDFQIAIQTNATLLNNDIIKILEDNIDLLSERLISISIDGPQYINDKARIDYLGKSSFSSTLKGIELIKNSKLQFSTISVIGSHNINYPEDVYFFNKEIGANLCKFIPCYNFDNNGLCEKLGINPIQYADFMCEIFDLWMHDIKNLKSYEMMAIDPIVTILSKLSNSFVPWCEFRNEKCDNFICFYPDGELWLCDSMNHSTMKQFGFIGNIHKMTDDEYKKALSNPCNICHYTEFYNKMMKKCENCNFYNLCNGGCLPTRDTIFKKSPKIFEDYCTSKKQLISHILRGYNLAISI